MVSLRNKISSGLAVAALSLTFCMNGVNYADAQTALKQNLDYIVTSTGAEVTDEAIRAEILSAIEEMAQGQGVSVEEMAEQVAAESRTNTTSRTGLPSATAQNEPNSGGGQRTVAMNMAHYTGDVFYSSNSTFGVVHGHNGIYYNASNYVESAGFSQGVKKTYAGHAVAPAPAYKYYVGWNRQSPNKIAAANFALAQVGKPYNGVFFNNKRVYSDKYNCSQLVWAAYKSVDPNVDMDANGGLGVYPADIANSSWTTWYETRS